MKIEYPTHCVGRKCSVVFCHGVTLGEGTLSLDFYII